MGEAEPTGITLEDLYKENLKFLTYEGRQMVVVGKWVEDERVVLGWLPASDPWPRR